MTYSQKSSIWWRSWLNWKIASSACNPSPFWLNSTTWIVNTTSSMRFVWTSGSIKMIHAPFAERKLIISMQWGMCQAQMMKALTSHMMTKIHIMTKLDNNLIKKIKRTMVTRAKIMTVIFTTKWDKMKKIIIMDLYDEADC